MEITYTVTITDLIQTIGVGLGFPAALWGLVKLFVKDKDKAKQIKALTEIAESQNTSLQKMDLQIFELGKQTKQLEYQSTIFKEGNDLLREQINIQTSAFINDKDHQEKLLAIETKKRKLEIRPSFILDRRSIAQNVITISVRNNGNRAYFQGIEEIETNDVQLTPQSKHTALIEPGKEREIGIKVTNSKLNSNNVRYKFKLLFSDEDGNKYEQMLDCIGMNCGITFPPTQTDGSFI